MEGRFVTEEVAALVHGSQHRRPHTLEASVMRQYARYQDNADALAPPVIDTSDEARLRFQILLIAERRGWHVAITQFLHTKCVGSLEHLTLPQLDDLYTRMQGYEDAAQTGCDMPDDLPAR